MVTPADNPSAWQTKVFEAELSHIVNPGKKRTAASTVGVVCFGLKTNGGEWCKTHACLSMAYF